MKSLSEIDTTSKRATRAAGFSWGIAEEVGKNMRLLELYGLPGIKNLNKFLKDYKEKQFQKITLISETNKSNKYPFCPIILGTNFIDQVNLLDKKSREDIYNFDDEQDLRNLETPETSMMSKEIVAAVNQTIETLPDELKEAIKFREMEGLSYEEISDLMNCPIGTVRSRIFRAREAIAEKLKPLIETTNKRW